VVSLASLDSVLLLPLTVYNITRNQTMILVLPVSTVRLQTPRDLLPVRPLTNSSSPAVQRLRL
jgi:hypothetical protein